MYPVVSKPAHAIGTANSSADGNMIDHQSQCGNDGINENESNHFLDPNLADIISNVILKLNSNKLMKKKKFRASKYPCSVCEKNVNKNQKAIQCSQCQLWSHASCNGIGKSEHKKLIDEDDDVPWHCIPCLVLENSRIFPFGFLSKTELCDLMGVDLPSQLDLLPSFEIASKLTNLPKLNSCDLENLVQTINSSYHKISDLPKANFNSHFHNFSLFHVNIRSLTKHFDELHLLLHSSEIPFDVIGISESKQLINREFPTNVEINDYQLHSQPTKSTCGGVAMYVKKSLDHKVLNHLNALEDEFETLWIEINTGPKSKNIIVCCAYRHPDTDARKFTVYLESILSKIDKNKTICIMGDFNINLLNYESHSNTNEFINSMVSHHLLPHILQPTRVTDHSATIIDNIFTNATEYDTISGNILNQLADHFSQFLIMKKISVVHKDATYCKYDYSKFDKDKFLSDFSKICWDEDKNISTDVNTKFSIFHEKVTDCVRSHVPLIKLSRKQLFLQSKPWISVRIKNMIAKRDKYLRRFNKTHSLDMEYLYKKFRNKVVTEIRKSKNDYYADYFTKHKTNMKMLWSGIRSIVSSNTNIGSNISSLIHNGAKTEDSKKMANICICEYCT